MAALADRLNGRFEGRGLTFARGAMPLGLPAGAPGRRTRGGAAYEPVVVVAPDAAAAVAPPPRRRPCVRETCHCLVVAVDVPRAAPPRPRVLEARLGDAVVLGVPRSTRFANPDDIYDLIAGPAHPGGTFELVDRERTLA